MTEVKRNDVDKNSTDRTYARRFDNPTISEDAHYYVGNLPADVYNSQRNRSTVQLVTVFVG